MVKSRIRRCDLTLPWRASSTGWTAGDSFVHPFRNPGLEDFAVSAGNKLFLVVRERLRSGSSDRPQSVPGIPNCSTSTFLAAQEEVCNWPLEFLSIELLQESEKEHLTIRAGKWGTACLYLLAKDGTLFADWDPAELYQHLGSSQLDWELAAHFLVGFRKPYSRRTLFPEIQRLTQGAVARWCSTGELKIDYPVPADIPRPGVLKANADVLFTFEEILTASIQRWIGPEPAHAGAELSGGLDSGVVAARAASVCSDGLRTYGLIVPGLDGVGQARRRQELNARFRFTDTSIPAINYPLLALDGSRLRDGRVVPWEEIYFEPSDQLMSIAASQGCKLIFTGTGGDELCYPHWQELSEEEKAVAEKNFQPEETRFPYFNEVTYSMLRDTFASLDRAPHSAIPGSALEAMCAVSFLFLKHGLWFLSPLCTPELVTFCRRLPKEWRANRKVQRKLLAHWGCSELVADPASTEDFEELFSLGIKSARPLLESLFTNSRLAELGLVNKSELTSCYSQFCQDRPGLYSDLHFYTTAILELTILSLEAKRTGDAWRLPRFPPAATNS